MSLSTIQYHVTWSCYHLSTNRRPDTSGRHWRRLPPCPRSLPWCPWNAPAEIYKFLKGCPCPLKNEAHRPDWKAVWVFMNTTWTTVQLQILHFILQVWPSNALTYYNLLLSWFTFIPLEDKISQCSGKCQIACTKYTKSKLIRNNSNMAGIINFSQKV